MIAGSNALPYHLQTRRFASTKEKILMSKDQYVYFTFNNWEPGKYYPDAEPFREWVEHWFSVTISGLKRTISVLLSFLMTSRTASGSRQGGHG